MKVKAKKFSHKLLALFMAVLMALTCFSGAFSAYAASKDVKYLDDAVEYNDLAWNVLSDEQTATALLDYADDMLAEFGPQIDALLKGALPTSGVYKYDANKRTIEINAVVVSASIKVYTHSVDEILETLESVESVLRDKGNLLGDAGNIQLGSTGGMRRSNTSSCDIIKGILGILQKNSADYNGKDVLGEFLRGGFDLGTLGTFVKLDIYGAIGGLLGCDAGWESNSVYNIVQSLIFNNTNWFTDEEKANYKANPSTFIFDDVLLEKMTAELLQKINVLVTYPDGTSSISRREAIDKKMDEGNMTYRQACIALGYDENLVYSKENTGNVLLFVYGADENGEAASNATKLTINKGDNLFDFGYKALDLAWTTVLEQTVKLVHVNNNVDRGHGSNFDNVYYYWATSDEGKQIVGAWDQNNLADMYKESNINAWAEAKYADYSAKDAAEFLSWVRNNYEFDRTVAEGAKGIWSDIDETTLFNKVRYSPLADYGFNMQTGPINLYFMQTGTSNLDAFFESYSNYSSLVGGFNDCLVAAVKDIFVQRDNIDGSLAELATVNPSTINDNAIISIVNTLVGNALKVVQYTADATDKNILNGFYTKYGASAELAEANLEEAMLPMLIACLGQVNLGSGKLESIIHPEDWDACQDAEAVIYLCLREYLSYILPDKNYDVLVTKSETSITPAKAGADMLQGVLLPMARDAVVYVMQGYVPVTGTDGNEWRVEYKPVDDSNTLLQLLNSVICYYGGEYDYKNSSIAKSVGAMGVGALLGVCSPTDGTSLITTDNTIWQNIDLVANQLLPVLGTLQYGDSAKKGQFSSEDLIWNDVVLGILDIGNTSIHDSGMGGVSNFLYRLLTIVSAEPIQSTPIVLTIYDVAADFLNGLFGARYNGQSFDVVVPARTSAHPFDDVLQINVIAGTGGNNIGVIGKFLCNLVEFAGYGTSGVNTYPDSILRGLMFAIDAVNSFIPEAITSIGEHDIKMATSEFKDSSVQGCTTNNAVNSSVTFTNNSVGINNAYVDGLGNGSLNNGMVEQLSRYYVKITKAEMPGATITMPSQTVVAPGESVSLPTSARYVPDENNSTSYSATITYNICSDKEGKNALYSGLETTCYQYLTGAKGWEDIVYPADRGGQLNTALEGGRTAHYQTFTTQGYRSFSSRNFRDGKLYVTYPEYMVVTTSNLAAIDRFQFRVNNENLVGSSFSVDGFYCYDDTSVYDDVTGAYVAVNMKNAIPVYDKETGDLIKYGMYDYKIDNGDWQRNGKTGYTEDEINNVYNQNPNANIEVRTHISYTLQEAIDAGIVAAYHKNDAGVIEYYYMKSGSGTNYDTTLGQVSLRGPVDGIYINQGKVADVPKNGSKYTTDLFKYDGSTPIQAGEYQVKLCVYSSYNNGNGSGSLDGPGTCTLVVGDDGSATSLNAKYKELSELLANYRTEDFTDATVKTDAEAALINALSANSAVITPTSAIALSDQTYLAPTTTTTTSEYGDKAYKPFSESNATTLNMPIGVRADAYVGDGTNGVAGYYYFDAACTMPIYSNVPLEASDVTDGKDPAGNAVIEGTQDDAGKFWLRNTPVYETEWNTTTYQNPWREVVVDDSGNKVQAKNGSGELLYSQVTYVYRNASSEKVNSDFVWFAKFPATEYKCIENDGVTEYRGLYTQANDKIAWAIERVYDSVNTSIAQDLFEKISLVRNNMNNNNFEVVTYNKMVDMAKVAESGYTLNITYDYKENVLDADGKVVMGEDGKPQTVTKTKTDTGVRFSQYNGYVNNKDITITNTTTSSTLSSVQVEEYLRLFNIYMNKVVERGYLGDKLEAEIACASGNAHDLLNATPAQYNEAGEKTADAVVTKTADAAAPEFGAWDASGKLVNNGDVVYADDIWTEYVDALANAVNIANIGNNNYAHATKAYYQADAKESYTAQVTDCYSADTNLQKAEIKLEGCHTVSVADVPGGTVAINGATYDKPYAVTPDTEVVLTATADANYRFDGFEGIEPDEEGNYVVKVRNADVVVTPIFTSVASSGHTVTASLVVATTPSGATDNVAVNGDYTITVYNEAGEVVATETFAMAKDANTFSFELPAGTYTATIESAYSLIRQDITIVVGDSDVTGPAIPIIACDYDGSTTISGGDAATVYANAAGAGGLFCDLDGSGTISGGDAAVVYACATGTPNLAPVTIG